MLGWLTEILIIAGFPFPAFWMGKVGILFVTLAGIMRIETTIL